MEDQEYNQHILKMKLFISKLPKMSGGGDFEIVDKENKIIKLFLQNQKKFSKLFSKPNMFPDMDFAKARAFFLTALRDYTVEQILPTIDYFEKHINFNIIEIFDSELEKLPREIIIDFYKKLILTKEVRKHFVGTKNSVFTPYIYKYLMGFHEKMGYGTRELFKYQEFEKIEDYVDFLKICVIIRNVLFIKIPVVINGKKNLVNYEHSNSNPILKREYFFNLKKVIKKLLPGIPEFFIKISMNSVINNQDATGDVEAASKFLKIIVERAKYEIDITKKDRGADTPDKSWFNTARKSYSFYGFDIEMLEQFYYVASDNGW